MLFVWETSHTVGRVLRDREESDLDFFLHLFILCAEVGGTHATVCTWRAKDSLEQAGCSDLRLSVGFGDEGLYPLSQLSGPELDV